MGFVEENVMRLLRRTYSRASNGAPYDPEKFKQAQRTVTATDDIILDVMRNGYALIPVREKNKIRARLARENLRYRYTQLDSRRVKVTPVKE